MRRKGEYAAWGITAFLVVAGLLVFYDIVFQNSVLVDYLDQLVTILAPVSYGVVMAYLLCPVVNWVEGLLTRRGAWPARLARTASIFITWVLVLILVYVLMSILLPQLYQSILTLVSSAEGYYRTALAWVERFLEDNPTVEGWLSDLIGTFYTEARAWLRETLLPQAQTALVTLTSGILGVVNFLKNLLVGIIVSIYLLATKESFAATSCKVAYSLLPRRRAGQVIRGVKEVNRIFSGFFRGKILDSLIIGLICFVGSSILQLPYAPLVSVVVCVTDMIPFFGPFLGAIPSALLILLDSPVKCLYFIIFIIVLQQFDGNILAPKILGDSTGISSFWVIVAILVGGGLWGVGGMFVGVPVFACLYTGVRRFCAWRLREKGLPTHSYNYRTHRPVPDEELGRQTPPEE